MTEPQRPHQRLDYQASIDRPKLTLPGGKRVAVFLVVNIERWDIDRAMPRQVLTAPQGASVTPDLPNWAWHEYGMRVGFWRLKAALDLHGIAPTLAINGTVPAAYPRVTKACRDAGWEFMVHGYHQMATHLVEDQRAMIRDAIDRVARGRRPRPRRLARARPDRDPRHPRPAGRSRYPILRRLGHRRSAGHDPHHAWPAC